MEIQKGDYVNLNSGEFKGEVAEVIKARESTVSVFVAGAKVSMEKDNAELIG